MPTFRNQIRVKSELAFAERVNQLWSLGTLKLPPSSGVEVQSSRPVRSCCLSSSKDYT